MNYPNFKVCVRCFTFNQANYIEDAMNGFTMQQTDFPFVCCIVDDASTDEEQRVIWRDILIFQILLSHIRRKRIMPISYMLNIMTIKIVFSQFYS